jgi:hypothetical protein
MGTKVSFPNTRLPQATIGNPLFVTDIVNANEDLLESLAVIYGFASNGFAILSGFDYGSGAYTGGVVYMNGQFYKCVNGLSENKYLTPNVQDVYNKLFSDTNNYPTYRVYQAIESSSQWGGMPIFAGNMNQYRISIKKVKDYISAIDSALSTEILNRTNADTALQTNISNEVSARASADMTLQTNITSEANTRSTNDTALQTNISNEVSARASADMTLQTNITNEANTRASADTTLASDATAKANAAQANAVATAASDATAKANAAQANAISVSRIIAGTETKSTGSAGTQTGSASAGKTYHYLNIDALGASRVITYNYTLNADAKEAAIKIHAGYATMATINIYTSDNKLLYTFISSGTDQTHGVHLFKVSTENDWSVIDCVIA